jgi:predicted nucleic acid-binding protein
VARLRYLADTSVFARLAKPSVVGAFAPLAAGGQIALCSAVAFELGFSSRRPADYTELTDRLSAFDSLPTNEADHRRGLQVQAALAARSQHRALSLVDALVAAVAEAHDLTVLHYDADFELIADVTGQPQEWIVPRGTAD